MCLKNHRNHISHFFASWRYSLSGLKFAYSETAIRQELVVGLLHLIVLLLFDFTLVQGLIVSLGWIVVFVSELLNSAIEAVVNLVSPEYHPLAKRAKDIGSAAVFCALCSYFATWALVVGSKLCS